MALPWVRLDVGFPRNPKVLALLEEKEGHRAAFVYLCGLVYCGEQGTDGFIPRSALPLLHGRPRDSELLASHDLWFPQGRSGWDIHDWHEFQQSNVETQARRERAQFGAKKTNCRRWHGPDCHCWKGDTR